MTDQDKIVESVQKYITENSDCALYRYINAKQVIIKCSCGRPFTLSFAEFKTRKHKVCTTCKKRMTREKPGSTYAYESSIEGDIEKIEKGVLDRRTYIVKSRKTAKNTYMLRILQQDNKYRICNLTKCLIGSELYNTHSQAVSSIYKLVKEKRIELIAVTN